MKHRNGKSFSLRIILPTLFAIFLFVISMFVVIIAWIELYGIKIENDQVINIGRAAFTPVYSKI